MNLFFPIKLAVVLFIQGVNFRIAQIGAWEFLNIIFEILCCHAPGDAQLNALNPVMKTSLNLTIYP